MYSFSNHIDLMISFISQKKRPVVLEFGVERGSSTKKFIEFAEKNSGKVFSVDIADCSNVSNSECWKFLQSNDLNVEHVIDTFNEIKNEVFILHIMKNFKYCFFHSLSSRQKFYWI